MNLSWQFGKEAANHIRKKMMTTLPSEDVIDTISELLEWVQEIQFTAQNEIESAEVGA